MHKEVCVNDADIVDAVDDFLMHFGVMGMKWGIRNSNALTRTLDEDRQKQVFKARNFLWQRNSGRHEAFGLDEPVSTQHWRY